MVSILFFWVLCTGPGFKANLEAADLFDPYGLQALQIGENLLVCSRSEPTLAVFDPSGQLLSTYQKAGPGPDELEFPCVIGIGSNVIYVVNRSKNILAFDFDLKRVGTMPSFPPEIGVNTPRAGKSLGNDEFLIENTMMVSSYGILKIRLNESSWETIDSYFPQHSVYDSINKDAMRNFPRIVMDSDYFYGYNQNLRLGTDEYEVKVFEKPSDTEPAFILVGPIEAETIINDVIGFINRVGQNENGFVVEYKCKNPNEPNNTKRRLIVRDFFNKFGERTKRETTEDSIMIPIQNVPRLLKTQIINDELMLVNF